MSQYTTETPQKTTPETILATALAAWDADLAPYIVKQDGSKAPDGAWGGKDAKRPSREWVAQAFGYEMV